MPAPDRTTADILRAVRDTLATAEHGLEDLTGGPTERKLVGLRNLVVFGRAVTNVVQNLRSKEPKFDEWYGKYQQEMKSDPLMSYFYELRSEILKKGSLGVSHHTHIRHLELPRDLHRFGPAPPNARGFFIGDSLGGSGWEVELPDGSIEKYYVELPSDIGSTSLHFPDAPDSHLGQQVSDSSIQSLSTMYIGYLRQLVESAEKEFAPK